MFKLSVFSWNAKQSENTNKHFTHTCTHSQIISLANVQWILIIARRVKVSIHISQLAIHIHIFQDSFKGQRCTFTHYPPPKWQSLAFFINYNCHCVAEKEYSESATNFTGTKWTSINAPTKRILRKSVKFDSNIWADQANFNKVEIEVPKRSFHEEERHMTSPIRGLTKFKSSCNPFNGGS